MCVALCKIFEDVLDFVRYWKMSLILQDELEDVQDELEDVLDLQDTGRCP